MAIHPLPLQEYQYRLGVDVGGTNTDAVIVDTTIQDQAKSVIATHKSPTTSPNVTEGIESAIISVLRKSNIDHDRIASLAIGTTHFINAIVEHDVRHLARVAVLRLSKSYTREIPPFSDFPPALRDTIRSYCGQIDGGLQIDGSLEAPIVESQVVRECAAIKERNLNAVVVSAVFSPLDNHFQQEQRVRDIIKREIPGAVVVCSSEIANLGFLERENASILNASINRFARRTIGEFKMAMKRLNLRCGLYLTQNDGTLIDADTAARLPIRTFSSGPTNSMRGAAYLCGLSSDSAQNSSPTIVCDIGGTTSDVGVLLPSGFPRQALAGVSIAGVRVNYSLPQVESVGLGGGSIVRQDAGEVTVGRDSVGFAIKDKALVFGGDMMTATDIAVAAGTDSWIGQPSLVKTIHPELISKAQAVIKRHLEHTIDLVKTSPVPLTLILVGGGSIIAPGQLNGITSILRPPHHDVANAVGAAMARVGVTVDIIQNMANQTVAEAMQRAVDLALSRAALGGARAGTVTVAEQESLPLQYVEHQLRTVVKVIGDFSPLEPLLGELNASDHEDAPYQTTATQPASVEQRPNGHLDILTYRPKIVKNSKTGIQEWIVSSVDLEWLADGCYVLGCGGGGSPYPEMLKLRQHLEEGHDLRIMDAEDLRPESRIYWGGNMGSPTVPSERLSASECIAAIKAMMEYNHHAEFDAVMGVEIGGSNGLQPLTVGSTKNFGRPVVDADWMGRAFPNLWQVTVAVQEENQIVPCSIASGDGRVLIMTNTPDDKIIDRTLRAPAVEMGCYVGFAAKPTSTALVHKWSVRNTLSQAWRIGRCIALATKNNTLNTVTEQIITEVGGGQSAKVLFSGKIVGIERRLYRGHSHGEVVIRPVSAAESEDDGMRIGTAVATRGELRIPFMNENILAKHINDDGEAVIACVPDLISVLNASTGKALGVGEYRYGVLVHVLGIACSPVWNSNERGLQAGGPAAFGYDDVVYQPLGVYFEPASVIREFGS